DAAVSNTLPVSEFNALFQILATRNQMALYHDTENAMVAGLYLAGHIVDYLRLVLIFLVAVGMTCIDHNAAGQTRLGQLLGHQIDALCVIIGRLAAAQNDMTIVITDGRDDGRMAAFGYRQKMMRLRRGINGVYGNLDIAIGSVLETHRARQARRQF